MIRAMGGVGDLVTMTPGLRGLAQARGRKVHFAAPARFAALFAGNPDVHFTALETLGPGWAHDPSVIDLTDCPAARTESATVPEVRIGRIEIFASAMGVGHRRLAKSGSRPVFEPSPEDAAAARAWLDRHGLAAGRFIAVQAAPAEVYKTYREMAEVARRLAEEYPVVVLHDRSIVGFDHPNLFCAFDLPLGPSCALACAAAVVVGADSSFPHLAGARDLPCVAVFGPTDGDLATKFYPRTQVVDQRAGFACAPCWRNEQIPCQVTRGVRSACLDSLQVDQIAQAALVAARHAISPITGPDSADMGKNSREVVADMELPR